MVSVLVDLDVGTSEVCKVKIDIIHYYNLDNVVHSAIVVVQGIEKIIVNIDRDIVQVLINFVSVFLKDVLVEDIHVEIKVMSIKGGLINKICMDE